MTTVLVLFPQRMFTVEHRPIRYFGSTLIGSMSRVTSTRIIMANDPTIFFARVVFSRPYSDQYNGRPIFFQKN